jgi:hypothetical protein
MEPRHDSTCCCGVRDVIGTAALLTPAWEKPVFDREPRIAAHGEGGRKDAATGSPPATGLAMRYLPLCAAGTSARPAFANGSIAEEPERILTDRFGSG